MNQREPEWEKECARQGEEEKARKVVLQILFPSDIDYESNVLLNHKLDAIQRARRTNSTNGIQGRILWKCILIKSMVRNQTMCYHAHQLNIGQLEISSNFRWNSIKAEIK